MPGPRHSHHGGDSAAAVAVDNPPAVLITTGGWVDVQPTALAAPPLPLRAHRVVSRIADCGRRAGRLAHAIQAECSSIRGSGCARTRRRRSRARSVGWRVRPSAFAPQRLRLSAHRRRRVHGGTRRRSARLRHGARPARSPCRAFRRRCPVQRGRGRTGRCGRAARSCASAEWAHRDSRAGRASSDTCPLECPRPRSPDAAADSGRRRERIPGQSLAGRTTRRSDAGADHLPSTRAGGPCHPHHGAGSAARSRGRARDRRSVTAGESRAEKA